MTPSLRQSLTILQLPVLELERYVQQQLLENPLLELGEDSGAGEEEREAGEEVAGLDLVVSASGDGQTDPRALPGYAADTGEGDGEDVVRIRAPAPGLHEHLHGQVRLMSLPGPVRAAAHFLIDCLDDNGYLTLDVEEASAVCGQPLAVVAEALRVVQSLDPPGVGARNLQECLLLQWEVLGDGNPLVPVLIREHLQDLAAGRWTRIADALGTTPEEVQRAADSLRSLDPKPGRRLGGPDSIPYVFPDVIVKRDGPDFVVLVHETPSMRPVLSPAYRRLLDAGVDLDPTTRRFLERKLRSALWLLRSLEQRRLTLLRVSETLVALQRPFFERGPRYLQPLTLRRLAHAIGVHESTVSRAVAGKYIQTPHGLFEFRRFFPSGVRGDTGPVSAENAKRLIAELVAGEDPHHPLSDREIAEALARWGVCISRRTVAKYREEAGIPSSARRRRYP